MRELARAALPTAPRARARARRRGPLRPREENTRFQQPAIFLASHCRLARLGDRAAPAFAAGHSLGELAALTAAGELPSATPSSSSSLRGRLMAEADDRGDGDARPRGRRRRRRARSRRPRYHGRQRQRPRPARPRRRTASARRGREAAASAASAHPRSRGGRLPLALHGARRERSRGARGGRAPRPRDRRLLLRHRAADRDVRAELAEGLRARSAGARPSARCTGGRRRASSRSARARCSPGSPSASWPTPRSRRRVRSHPCLRLPPRPPPPPPRHRVAHRARHRPRPQAARPRRAERPIAERHRRRRGVDLAPDRHPRAPRRRADGERTSDLATAAAAARARRRRPEPADVDLVLVATMSPDELTPNIAPVVAHALGADRAGAFDIGAACTGFLAGARRGRRPDRDGPRRAVLVIGAEILSRLTDPTTSAPPRCSATAPARSCSAPDGRGRDRPDRAASRRRAADRSTARTKSATSRMDGHATFNRAVKGLTSPRARRVRRAGVTLDDIDLFVYHQANGRILRAVGREARARPERVVDYVAREGNTSAASIPLALVAPARGRPPARPAQRILLGARRRGLHLGRRRDRVGATRMSRPRASRRARHRRVQGHRRRDREGAGGRRLARRGQLPLRRGRRAGHRAGDRGGRRPRRRDRRRRRRRPAGGAVRGRRGAARPRARARQQRRRARGQPRHPDRRRGLGRGHRHQPQRRVPAHQARDPPDAQGALRPDREHRLRRRPAGQRRPGELRRREGRADRHDQDGRARGGAARHHGQRRRPRLHRDRHDQGPARGRRQGRPGPPAPASRRRWPPPCGSSPPTTPRYVTGTTLFVDGGMSA